MQRKKLLTYLLGISLFLLIPKNANSTGKFNFSIGSSYLIPHQEDFSINGSSNIPDIKADLSGYNLFFELAGGWKSNENFSFLFTMYLDITFIGDFEGKVLSKKFNESGTDIGYGIGFKPIITLVPGKNNLDLWVKPRLGLRNYHLRMDRLEIEGDNFIYGLSGGIDYNFSGQNYTIGPFVDYDLNNKRLELAKKLGIDICAFNVNLGK